MPAAPAIHERVRRSEVEADNRCARLEPGDIADSAQIYDRTGLACGTELCGVKTAGKGRALPAGGDVALTKLGDGINAGRFGNTKRVADLPGECGTGIRGVVHRLSVAPNRADRGGGEFGLFQ